MSTRLFLIGPMGSGKSTIGRLLARRLGLAFHDSDEEIVDRTGVDIATIFDIEGEAGFRRREQQVVAELARLDDVVIATGGGAVTTAATRELLEDCDGVIYLETSVAQQLARTAHDRGRPLLQNADREQRLTELMAQREPLYRAVANLIIATDGMNPKAVARRIEQALQTRAEAARGESRK